jgi:putative nucleotidyltransferase with HDIG domain
MAASRRAEGLLRIAQVGLIAASIAVTAVLSDPDDWQPVELVVLLAGVAILSGAFPLEIRGVKASGSFLGIVLVMALLGPAPALVVSLLTMVVLSAAWRVTWRIALCNVAAYATFPALGGVLFFGAEKAGITHDEALPFAMVVFAVFMVTNFCNFLLIAVDLSVTGESSIRRELVDVYVPCLPVQVTSAMLTATLALAYDRSGLGVVVLLIAVGLIFQYLLHLAFQSMRRGEQLEARTRELATLQVGLLETVIKTLSLRDKMTARHSAAVARYAREMARAIGMPEREADVLHTAALLHDIGKFVFPDSILFADRRLTEADMEIVRSHPARGAELVASIETYGPVADIILAHHERIDGTGYPNRIAGEDIPLAARIISICDTFDVMTARDSYRRPVSREKAFAELRRVAGSQLDAELVEVFVELLQDPAIAFRHTDDTDFDSELEVERRAREYAAPRDLSDRGPADTVASSNENGRSGAPVQTESGVVPKS